MRRVFPLFLASAAIASPSLAADDPRPLDEHGTISAVWENDYFARTDRNYTNGLRLSYVSGQKEPAGVSRILAETFLGADETTRTRRGFAIGQSIFTPEDIATAAPLPDQHPYAGWLYGEYSVVVQKGDGVDQFALQAGVVGSSAGGEFVQNNWHRLIGGAEAQGWDNQIDDEFGLMLSYEHRGRALAAISDNGFGVDLTPNYGFSAGNVQTYARAGLTLRVGQGLTNDYGPPRVRPALAGAGYFAPSRAFSWYLFAGAEGRAVAHDIFLDGSLFREDDPSVDSNTFIGDFQAGLVTQFRGLQVAYTYVYRTREFEQQPDAQQFGAVSLSAKF